MAMVFLWAYDLRKKLCGYSNKKHSFSKIFFEAENFSTCLENKNSSERQKNLPPTVFFLFFFFLWLFSFMFWLILTKEKNCRKFSFNMELKFREKFLLGFKNIFFVQNRVRNNKIFFSKGWDRSRHSCLWLFVTSSGVWVSGVWSTCLVPGVKFRQTSVV